MDLLSDDEYGEFQADLAASPELGTLLQGGGGIRKTRVALPGRGKSGGARVIYYWAVKPDLVLLLVAFAKNERTNFSPKQLAMLAKAVKEEFKHERQTIR